MDDNGSFRLLMRSRYCALTHNTAPFIKTTECPPVLFDPLLEKYPRLQRLVQLISLNGQILERLYTQPYTYENVIGLESIMSHTCARIGKPTNGEWQGEDMFEFGYEALVQIHIFW